jgi:hypothetical protein
VLAALVLGASWLGAGPASGAENTPEHDVLNQAYAVYLGSGIYVANERTAFIFRFSPAFRVRSEEEHAMGLRVRLTATLGFYDLAPGDLRSLDLPDRLATAALMPGVEFPVRIHDNWTLMPLLDVGVATDTGMQETTVVWGVGTRSRADWSDPRLDYILWNEMIWAGNRSTEAAGGTSFFNVFRTDLELRRLVDYTLFDQRLDLGLLVRADYYFEPLLIGPPTVDAGRSVEVHSRAELGFTSGPTEKLRAGKVFTVPRLGVAYRFGGGDSGVSILFRFHN